MASRYTRPAAALAASALVVVTAAILYGAISKQAGASRVLVDAYCDDGDGGITTLTLDVRVPPGSPADGGWTVEGDAGPIFVRSLDEWADRIERMSDCVLIRESRRQDTADAAAWPTQAIEVRRRALDPKCRCLSVALPQTYVPVPCVVHAGREAIASEYGCLAGSNAEEAP